MMEEWLNSDREKIIYSFCFYFFKFFFAIIHKGNWRSKYFNHLGAEQYKKTRRIVTNNLQMSETEHPEINKVLLRGNLASPRNPVITADGGWLLHSSRIEGKQIYWEGKAIFILQRAIGSLCGEYLKGHLRPRPGATKVMDSE